MAQRRMFSPDIVNSDAFLEMPPSTQALYFQLGMKADDDGFVNPKMVMRMMGSSEDELKVLLAKRFIMQFENGVMLVKHWRINNFVRKDRYRETRYLTEKQSLYVKPNQAYSLNDSDGALPVDKVPWKSDLNTIGQPSGNQRSTQDRIGKDRIIKPAANASDFEIVADEKPNKAPKDHTAMILRGKLYEMFKKEWGSDCTPNIADYQRVCAALQRLTEKQIIDMVDYALGAKRRPRTVREALTSRAIDIYLQDNT